jgi:carbon-monoxide dehydrogenase large subunit
VYPGYVCAIVGALKLGRPVKWIETRTENLTSTGFARDYHIDVEIGATADGRVTALRVATAADHGAFDAAADPRGFPAGLFGIVTGSYDFPVAHAEVDGFFTNKAPGGIAYRCSFRVTEASYAIERGMDILADELGIDPVDLRRKNFVRRDQFPYPSRLGFTYDSGDYHKTLDVALEKIGYQALLKEQAEKRARGELMGIGVSTFTEVVGAGPSKQFNILGIKMFDSAEIRIHPTGAGIVRAGTKSQGQGHETTWAQIVAEELGLDPQNIMVEEGDTDTAPYGLGTYASRSTPVAGAAIAMAARRIREKARKVAAHLLEVGEADVEWRDYTFQVKGVPARRVTMKQVAFAAYTNMAQNEPGLEATYYYDPPNMTFPYGTYIAVVDVDRDTGEVKVRRFLAVDDCGTIINPVIVEGQIHGGLTEGFAIAFMQEIQYDSEGNNLNTNFTDYLLPTSLETPHWDTAKTTTPSPHHPIGAKGVGESPNVGSPAAFVNAVIDALSPLGVRHIDMPLTRDKVWRAIRAAEAKKASA